MARLKQFYLENVVNQLKKQFNYSSVMQVPRISKITLNMGVGEAVADKKVMDNLLKQVLKNIESKSSISGVRLTADVDPSDLTKKTNVMVRKATDSVAKLKQQAEEDTKQALQTIKAVQTKAIKSNVTAGSTPNPTMATPTVPSSGSKSTVMTTSSDGSEAKANPTVRDALVSLQTAVGDQAEPSGSI